MTEDEMVEWHHGLNGHEFEQNQGNSEGQGSLVCYNPWGHKESDRTQHLNNKMCIYLYIIFIFIRVVQGHEVLQFGIYKPLHTSVAADVLNNML